MPEAAHLTCPSLLLTGGPHWLLLGGYWALLSTALDLWLGTVLGSLPAWILLVLSPERLPLVALPKAPLSLNDPRVSSAIFFKLAYRHIPLGCRFMGEGLYRADGDTWDWPSHTGHCAGCPDDAMAGRATPAHAHVGE